MYLDYIKECLLILFVLDSYDAARSKLSKAAKNSNLESEEESQKGRGKRMKTPFARLRETSDEDGDGRNIPRKMVRSEKEPQLKKNDIGLPRGHLLPPAPESPYSQSVRANRNNLPQVLQAIKSDSVSKVCMIIETATKMGTNTAVR